MRRVTPKQRSGIAVRPRVDVDASKSTKNRFGRPTGVTQAPRSLGPAIGKSRVGGITGRPSGAGRSSVSGKTRVDGLKGSGSRSIRPRVNDSKRLEGVGGGVYRGVGVEAKSRRADSYLRQGTKRRAIRDYGRNHDNVDLRFNLQLGGRKSNYYYNGYGRYGYSGHGFATPYYGYYGCGRTTPYYYGYGCATPYYGYGCYTGRRYCYDRGYRAGLSFYYVDDDYAFGFGVGGRSYGYNCYYPYSRYQCAPYYYGSYSYVPYCGTSYYSYTPLWATPVFPCAPVVNTTYYYGDYADYGGYDDGYYAEPIDEPLLESDYGDPYGPIGYYGEPAYDDAPVYYDDGFVDEYYLEEAYWPGSYAIFSTDVEHGCSTAVTQAGLLQDAYYEDSYGGLTLH